MTTCIALLRGVNVGGHRKVPMAELRAACADAGFAEVRSYIQSGNLVFSASGDTTTVERGLEEAIRTRFGFTVDAMVRTAAEWDGYIAANPLPLAAATAPGRVMIVLSRPPLDAASIAALADRADGEELAAAGDVLFVHFPRGAGRSKLAAAIARGPSTARNWRTVLALAALAAGDPST